MPDGNIADAPEKQRRWFLAPQPEDDLSSHGFRQAVGYVGFLLPWLLIAVERARTVAGFPGWSPLDSISQYYHSGATVLFTGALAALAIFLFTYRGFENDSGGADRALGFLAGTAALGVGLFPTEPDPHFVRPGWWEPWMRWVHYGSATLLLGCFILYSLWLFPKSAPGKARSHGKPTRNRIYVLCGIGMILCVSWAGIAGLILKAEIFWPETFALALFGWSWLTKGRAGWTWARILSGSPAPTGAAGSPNPSGTAN
jgi:hypothetical protein